MILRRRRGSSDQSGQTLVMFAVIFPLFIVLMLVVVDLTHAFDSRRGLQNAADAAALAAAYDVAQAQPISATSLAYSTKNGGPAVTGVCTVAVTTNCYVNPYNGDPNQVEVLLHTDCVRTFFGGLMNYLTGSHSFECVPESARAVGTVTGGGTPPAISFAALNSSCDAHTLLIESSGHLTVNNNIYVNSCSGHDGFDVFHSGSTPGSISAPGIYTTGGWESDKGTGVSVGTPATQCSLTAPYVGTNPGGKVQASPPSGPPSQPGCPTTGYAITADPFAVGLNTPTGATASCPTQSSTKAQYTPLNVTLKTTAGSSSTPVNFSPAVSLNGPAGTTSDGAAYNPNVTLASAAGTGPSPQPYIPNAVTLNAATGTSTNLNAYNPNVTLAAAAPAATTVAAYPTNVTLNGALGTSKDLITYNPNVTLNAAAPAATTVGAYPTNVTLNGAVGTSNDLITYNPSVTLKVAASNSSAPTAYAPAVTLNGNVTAAVTTVPVTGASVKPGDVIVIDSEKMLVTAVAGGNLTVVRGYLGTTAAPHNKPAPITHIPDATIQVGNGNQVSVNDTIQIDNEQMTVSNVVANGANWALTVTRGANGTTEAAHNTVNTIVYKVVGDTTVEVTQVGGGAQQVSPGDVIKVDNEYMLVNTVTAGAAKIWDLNVTRHFNGSTEAAHTATTTVNKASFDTRINVTAASMQINTGDTIQIDNEQMTVGTITQYGTYWILTVTRNANGTTEAAHNTVGTTVYKVVGDTTVEVTQIAGGTQQVNPGDVIKIDNEYMLVNTVTAGAAKIWDLNVTRHFNGSTEAAHTATTTVNKATLDTRIVVTGSSMPVNSGDTIQIDNEQMTVSNVAQSGSNWILTVGRGANGTTEAAHNTIPTTVYKVVAPNLVQVTNIGSAEVSSGDIIAIGSEYMLVNNVATGSANVWNLTVTRGYQSTTAAAHTKGASVQQVLGDTQIFVTNTGSTSAVHAGDVILIDNEQMKVNNVQGSSAPWELTVTRAFNNTTEASHTSGATVFTVTADTTLQVTNTGGTSSVAIGDVIQVDSEQMLVTNVTAGAAQVWNLTVTRGYNATTEAAHAQGAAVKNLADQVIQVTNTGNSPEVQVGDWIQIDSEQMYVNAVNFVSGHTWNVTVTRAYLGTGEATHNTGATVYLVTAVTEDPNNPAPCAIPYTLSGGGLTATLHPGIYYGGICIGAAPNTDCVNINGTTHCAASGGSTVTVTPYASGEYLSQNLTGDDTDPTYNTVHATASSGTGTIAVNDLIAIDDEEMLVAAVATSGANQTLTVTREANGTDDGPHTGGTSTTISKVTTTPNGTTPGSPPTVTLTQGVYIMSGGGFAVCGAASVSAPHVLIYNTNDTTGGSFTAFAPAVTLKSTSNPAIPATPATGSVQFYTGGGPAGGSIVAGQTIQINSAGGNEQFTVTGVTTVGGPGNPAGPAGANQLVTATRAANGTAAVAHLANDAVLQLTVTGYGALGQVDINTSGNVRIGPQTDGAYAGMTIFQDRSLQLTTATSCDARKDSPYLWDIALQSMAAAGPISGPLGSISGTIYAPAQRADFGDSVSGTANLAVITGCIFINGATSTFNFNTSGGANPFFGTIEALTG
jgi:hypothetical protein